MIKFLTNGGSVLGGSKNGQWVVETSTAAPTGETSKGKDGQAEEGI